MSEHELQRLELLLERRHAARRALAETVEELEDYVLQMRESGASARGIADELNVGSSTIQTWTTNARRRRDG